VARVQIRHLAALESSGERLVTFDGRVEAMAARRAISSAAAAKPPAPVNARRPSEHHRHEQNRQRSEDLRRIRLRAPSSLLTA
jgi:hypothetical protein